LMQRFGETSANARASAGDKNGVTSVLHGYMTLQAFLRIVILSTQLV
jgi:hypothetical protein